MTDESTDRRDVANSPDTSSTRPSEGRVPSPPAEAAARLDLGDQIRLRLSTPGTVVGAIPFLFGFHPVASLVVLGLARSIGERQAQMHHALRFDLADVERFAPEFGRDIACRLRMFCCTEAVLVVYPPSDAIPRPYDHRRMLAVVRAQLRTSEVRVADALYVANGRWWSYTCRNPRCCPPEGIPVPSGDAPEVSAVATYTGVVVHRDREALGATLDPYSGEAVAAVGAALRTLSRANAAGVTVSSRRAQDLAADLLEACHGTRRAPAEHLAELLHALRDPTVRDHLACWAADERVERLLVLATELARHAVSPEYAAAPYTLVAWAAWALGRGALVQLALDRALAADPTYSFALLVREALFRGVPPEMVRATARAAAAELAEGRTVGCPAEPLARAEPLGDERPFRSSGGGRLA